MKTVHKYLARWAEPLAGELLRLLEASRPEWVAKHAVVVPAFAEGARLLRTLRSVPMTEPNLCVCVLNHREQAKAEQLAQHKASKQAIEAAFARVSERGAWSLWRHGEGLLAVVEVAVHRKQGVGEARKIGLDAVLACWSDGKLADRWLHSTDADVVLADDYFDVPAEPELAGGYGDQWSALIHPWRHVPVEDRLKAATEAYERRVRHHAQGLAWAGSPYGFETIGSTVAVDAQAYAQVRGVPKKAAGEDFYLLNKLAKVGRIGRGGGLVTIDGRLSERVPFGTGPALRKAGEAGLPGCYEPTLFVWLKVVLQAMRAAVDEERALRIEAEDPRLVQGVNERRLGELVQRCVDAPVGQRRRRLREGFDAFETMKLVHAWRALGLVDVRCRDDGAKGDSSV